MCIRDSSTVAGQCNLYVDRRFLPYETYDDVMAEFQAVLDRLSEKDPAFKCQMEVDVYKRQGVPRRT